MNQTYIDVKNLRYGSILIMANKDENSSYINRKNGKITLCLF